jgi:hypothetical protein
LRELAGTVVAFLLIGVLVVLVAAVRSQPNAVLKGTELLALALASLVILAYLARHFEDSKSLRIGSLRPKTNLEALVCRNVPYVLGVPLFFTFFMAGFFWFSLIELVYVRAAYGHAAWASGFRVDPLRHRFSNGLVMSEAEHILLSLAPLMLGGLTAITSWLGVALFVMKLRGERLADQMALYRRMQNRMSDGLDFRSLVGDRRVPRRWARLRSTVLELLLFALFVGLAEWFLHSLDLMRASGYLIALAFLFIVIVACVGGGPTSVRASRMKPKRALTTNLQALTERYIPAWAAAPFIVILVSSVIFWPQFMGYLYINAVYGPKAWASGLRIVGKAVHLSNGESLPLGSQILLGPGTFFLSIVMAVAVLVAAAFLGAYLGMKLRGERFRDQLALYRADHKTEVRELRALLRERLVDWTSHTRSLPADCHVPSSCPECGREHVIVTHSASVPGHRIVICDVRCPTCGAEHHYILALPDELPHETPDTPF